MSSTYSFHTNSAQAKTSFVSSSSFHTNSAQTKSSFVSSSSTTYDSAPPHNPWLGAGPGRRLDEDDPVNNPQAQSAPPLRQNPPHAAPSGGGGSSGAEPHAKSGAEPHAKSRVASSTASSRIDIPSVHEMIVQKVDKARRQGKYYNTATGRILAFNSVNKKKYVFYDSHICGEVNSIDLNKVLGRFPGTKLNDPPPPRPQSQQQPPRPQPQQPQPQQPQPQQQAPPQPNQPPPPQTQQSRVVGSDQLPTKLWPSCYNYKLKAFKFGRYKRSENYTYSKCNESTCYVCLEEYDDDDDITIATCDHYFHSHCLEEWLKVHHSKNTCAPSCMVCHKRIERCK